MTKGPLLAKLEMLQPPPTVGAWRGPSWGRGPPRSSWRQGPESKHTAASACVVVCFMFLYRHLYIYNFIKKRKSPLDCFLEQGHGCYFHSRNSVYGGHGVRLQEHRVWGTLLGSEVCSSGAFLEN